MIKLTPEARHFSNTMLTHDLDRTPENNIAIANAVASFTPLTGTEMVLSKAQLKADTQRVLETLNSLNPIDVPLVQDMAINFILYRQGNVIPMKPVPCIRSEENPLAGFLGITNFFTAREILAMGNPKTVSLYTGWCSVVACLIEAH
jgi:hypothetical protein